MSVVGSYRFHTGVSAFFEMATSDARAVLPAHTHDGALSELLLDLGDRRIDVLPVLTAVRTFHHRMCLL